MTATIDIAELLAGFARKDDLSEALGSKASAQALQDLVAEVAALATMAALEELAASVDGRRMEFQQCAARPGDGPVSFTVVQQLSQLSGPGRNLPLIPDQMIVTSDAGAVVRMTGAGIIAMRAAQPVDPRRIYRPGFVVQRRTNPSDPSGDAIVLGVAWFDRFQVLLPQDDDSSIVVSIQALRAEQGRQEVQSAFCRSASPDAVFRAPSRARYARCYVFNHGADGVTDIELLELVDVTNATVLAPETADTVARVGALESGNFGPRMAALESQIGTPKTLTFATKGDAEAAEIAETVDTVLLTGRDQAGDGFDGVFARVGSLAPGADGFVSDGATFQRVMPAAQVLGAWLLSLPTSPPDQPGSAWLNGGQLEVRR